MPKRSHLIRVDLDFEKFLKKFKETNNFRSDREASRELLKLLKKRKGRKKDWDDWDFLGV